MWIVEILEYINLMYIGVYDENNYKIKNEFIILEGVIILFYIIKYGLEIKPYLYILALLIYIFRVIGSGDIKLILILGLNLRNSSGILFIFTMLLINLSIILFKIISSKSIKRYYPQGFGIVCSYILVKILSGGSFE